jgi:UPF0042 nucleotide-binding protein
MNNEHDEKGINPLKEHLQKEVVIVTGLSGAGKTGVVRVLEDLGYYCVDNLPIPMILTFLEFASTHHATSKIALGIDVRGKKFLETLLKEIDSLKQNGWKSTIIFLDASDATLVKRYQETRRRHPLEGTIGLPEAILLERTLLEPIMHVATITINTDQFNLHELRAWALKYFTNNIDYSLIVNFISFGFKYGIPLESSLLFDVRSLPNPHFIPHLQPKTGCTTEIQEFLFQDPLVIEYWNHLISFLEFSLKNQKKKAALPSRSASAAPAENIARSLLLNDLLYIHSRELIKLFIIGT